MAMTVQRLHKMLGTLIEQGHGRKPVCVDKGTFRHPLEEDGATILDVVECAGPKWIAMADDDGGPKFNQDGTESGKRVVVLSGRAKHEGAAP